MLVGANAGGYFPTAWRLSALSLLAFAAAALIGRQRIAISRLEWVLLAAFAMLTFWIAMSAIWSDRATNSLLESERALVYLSGITAILMVAERATAPHIFRGIVAAVTVIAAYALAVRAFDSSALDPVQGRLLYKPVGYANALGILIAIATVLAVGLAFGARTRFSRAVLVASLMVLLGALYLTSSRGAWLALVVGLGFGLWCALREMRWFVLLPLLAGAMVIAILLGSSNGQGLALGDENRPHYWHIALDDAAEHPIFGSGAGTYADYWIRHRPVDTFARDAHSLYLESLAELGPMGLILVVLALGIPLLTIRQRTGPMLAFAAGAYVAFLVHAGIDWDWEVPAVTLSGLFSGAAVLVGMRPGRIRPTPVTARRALFALVLLLAVGVAVRARTGGSYPL